MTFETEKRVHSNQLRTARTCSTIIADSLAADLCQKRFLKPIKKIRHEPLNMITHAVPVDGHVQVRDREDIIEA